MVAPTNTAQIPTLSPQRDHQKRQQIDYRLMVDAIQSGDLEGARQAHGRLTSNAGGNGFAGDTLTRIGAMLNDGDLTAAQRTLDGLQTKAVALLHRAADQAARKVTVPTGLNGRKLNISV